MNKIMDDEWKEFFINSFLLGKEYDKKPIVNHFDSTESSTKRIWKKVKSFFKEIHYIFKKDKNKICAINGNLCGKDAEKYIFLNKFLNCQGSYYKIFIEKWKERYGYDLVEASHGLNPFVYIYLSHLSIQTSTIIFEYFIYKHTEVSSDDLSDYCILDLSIDLLRLFSIFMTPSERVFEYHVLLGINPDLAKYIDDITKAL